MVSNDTLYIMYNGQKSSKKKTDCVNIFFSIFAEFEKNEKKRLEAELKAYEKQLEQDTLKEKEKHDKNVESLNKRKEDLIKERKLKMKVEFMLQLV